MARNGSGAYSLPAGNPVVTGTVISSSTMNTTLSDIATALTASIANDGQTVPVANIPMGGFKLTGLGAATVNGDAVRYQEAVLAGADAKITSMTALTAPTVAANPVRATDLQVQLVTAFTTGGTSTAYTLTPTPAITANTTNQRFRVKFNAASGATPTLAVSGQTAKNLKYYDSTGTKQAITSTQVPINWISDVEYDGTDWMVLQTVPPVIPAAPIVPPVRQTVYSGPVDSSGYSAFGGSTASTTVTATGTLYATAAAGGTADYSGNIVNPSWTGLSTNGTMYLYLDITSGGVVTTGSTTLAPVYQWGGTYSTTNLQNTFNIQEMTMKVGNGATAAQVYRVFVGEVTVAGNVVTAITWYALMGRYISPQTAVPGSSGTRASVNHNLGLTLGIRQAVQFLCVTADLNYSIGDVVEISGSYLGSLSYFYPNSYSFDRLAMGIVSDPSGTAPGYYLQNKTTGVRASITTANWKFLFNAKRDW